MLTEYMRALILACPNNLLPKRISTALSLMSFCAAPFHTRTKPYALTYILHFIMWTLQVLQEGQYSTQPLEWIMPGPETSRCQLRTELQPDESPGFLRPCGKSSTKQNQLFTENCPSNWTDHTTALKCKAYAFYSKSKLYVSNKKVFTS
jgi:hypothetical protein